MHGIGQRIDVCMYDAAVHSLSSFLTSHFAGQKAGRAGNGHTLTSPWGAYPAKDGFVIICTITNDQFKRLCELAGQPALASDPRFTSPAGRRKHVEVVDTLVSSLTQGRTVGAAIADLSRIGIPCGPIIDKADLAREPNMRHRRMFVGAEEATTGAHWLVPASPLRCEPPMSTTADRIALPDEDRMVVTRLIERCRRSHYPPGTTAAEDIRPLQGVRVVEIGQYTLAPFATRQMSALGADVIKVEPPQGDAIRKTAGAGGKSQIFAMMNTDKRGLVLDLNSEADREVLHQLLSQSDVLVENLKPGTLAGFGLSNEVLRQRYPQLVYCALSGFGADSAYPGRAALDTVVQGMSGLMSATTEDGVPYKTGYSASDLTGSYFGMLAILAGIEMHARYGIAPHFDIAMQDATAWLTTVATAESANLRAHRIVECADGHVLVEGNTAHLRELQSRFDDERDVAVAELQRKGYIATLVRSVAEVVKHPQTASRELLIKRSTLAGEEDIVLGCPLVLRGTPPRVGRLMAALGADTPEVVADLNLKQPRRTAAPLEGAG
jgi:crotonobetainyl-CoA:carnitine CoA-transferase CaiB-like acyl-CoA transferase